MLGPSGDGSSPQKQVLQDLIRRLQSPEALPCRGPSQAGSEAPWEAHSFQKSRPQTPSPSPIPALRIPTLPSIPPFLSTLLGPGLCSSPGNGGKKVGIVVG